MLNTRDIVYMMKHYGYFYINNADRLPSVAINGDVLRMDGKIFVYDGNEWKPSSEEALLKNAGLLKESGDSQKMVPERHK